MQIPVVRNVLEANEKMAAHVRRQLSGRKILTLNLISSPGAGKTSLLERTLRDLAGVAWLKARSRRFEWLEEKAAHA